MEKAELKTNSSKSYTLFAPTNFAIQKYIQDAPDAYRDLVDNKTRLETFLKGHITEGRLLLNHLNSSGYIELTALNGQPIKLEKLGVGSDTKLSIDGNVHAVPQDIESRGKSRDLIYLIDTVIGANKGTTFNHNFLESISIMEIYTSLQLFDKSLYHVHI